jgi:hypothetical protein
MEIRVITRRKAKIPNHRQPIAPRFLAKISQITQGVNPEFPTNPMIGKYLFERTEVFGFKDLLDDPESNDEFVVVSMLVPSYFEYKTGKPFGAELSGLFIIKVMGQFNGIYDYEDKQYGQYGCPQRLSIGPSEAFTFNDMEFFPFMMRDLSVGYYVCDSGSSAYSWKGKKLYNVALDAPLAYDATLGIYVTRGAHLVADPIKKTKRPSKKAKK